MPGTDSDITSTLSDLEHKLLALEHELSAVGEPAGAVSPAPVPPPLPVAPPAPLGDLYEQMRELERFRETLEQSTRALLDEYSRILEQLQAAAPALAAAAPAAAAPYPPPAPSPQVVAPPAPPAPGAQMVTGLIAVDAGPFGDIATLGQFEQALGRLPGAVDVYVKGFEGQRALVDVQLGAPIAFAAELARVSELLCVVRQTGPQSLAVDIGGPAGV